MPDFGASYNLRDKILVDANLFYTGKRYAPEGFRRPLNSILIWMQTFRWNTVIQSFLSFFLRLNNFTAIEIPIWNQYPAQRFQA